MTTETEGAQGLADAEPVVEPDIAEEGAAEPVEAAADPVDPAPADAEPPKSKAAPEWVDKRFGELTKQKHDAIGRAEKAEAEAAALRSLLEAQGADLGPKEGDTPPANGKTYTASELDSMATEKAKQIAAAQAFNAKADAIFDAGETEFGASFKTAIGNLRMAGVISPTDLSFLESALEVEGAEKVLHALGQDPDEAMRIAALPERRQAIELDRLARKLNEKPAPEQRKAPPPITPVDGAASPGFDPETAPMAEYIKWREAQEAKRRA